MSKSQDSKQLEALQFLGLVTKFVLIGISFIQGAIVIRLMTTSEYGLIGIVLAIVSIVGTYQHLGLGIGTLREIAIARDIDESSKIFVTSISARLAITIPIALGLYFLAPVVAIGIYNQPELIFGIKITSFIILANGIQEIGFNVLNGLQKFKKIFILQIVNSSFNMVLIIGMILLLKYNGYFVGNLITTIIFCLIFIIYTYLALEKKFIFPPRTDFIRIFKSIFGIGLFIYLAKIMFGFFSQSGILFLGYFSNNTEVGYLRFTIGYGSYILAFSNAVNFINLTIMSKKYRDNFESYKKDLKDNFTSLFFGTFFLIVIMVLFSKEAILIMAGSPYLTVQPIIIISVFIFFIHMLFELICTMTFLSTDDRLGYIFSYIVLTIVSTFAIFLFMYFGYGKIGALFGMLLGTLAALIFSTIRVRVKMNFWVFNGLIGLLILVGIPILVIGELDLNIYIRITAFIIFSITFWLISKKFNVINIIEILKNSFSKVKLSLVTKK